MKAAFTEWDCVEAALRVQMEMPGVDLDALNFGLRGLVKPPGLLIQDAAQKIVDDYMSGELAQRIAA